jgi:hypothetical protein
MFFSRYMPCSQCGASVDRSAADGHTCDPKRWIDYQLFRLRDEIAGFEEQLRAWLESPPGRFAVWYAARRR